MKANALRWIFSVIVSFVVASSAVAAELPQGVFQMRDGSYFHPASGFTTTNLEEMVVHVSSSTEVMPAATTTTFPLKLAISRAQDILQEAIRRDAASSTQPRVESSDDVFRAITLALWNPTTDAIRLVRALKKGRELRSNGDSIDHISVVRSNGLNSEFFAGDEIVVAIRYPIYSEKKGTGKKTVFEVSDVVYTPYSRALHTTEMATEGKRWFDGLVADVFARLRKAGVPSRAFPDRLLSDVMDPAFIKQIAIIEHVNEGALRSGAQWQVDRFFVTLAANEKGAYNYSKSSAGALGLVQFIPKTYAALTRWPHLELDVNFERGMRNPENAIRAQAAYLDYLLSRLPDEARISYANARDRAHEYLAAAYNGGATRVAKAMVVWEENLDPEERLHVRTRSRLRPETMKYVLKLRQLREALKQTPTLLVDAR